LTRKATLRAIAASVAFGSVTPANADDAAVVELPRVDVVATTPLPGLGVPLRDVPANVQIFGSRALSQQRPPTLTQFLEQNANSVGVGSGQGNPFQQSLDFRGLTASPLLGTPQGLSVFQDGVRINEAFGDVVNWDLLPRSAIANVQLVPGSVPAFGLNTLGGALAIETKSGAQFPGVSAEVSGGSFGTRAIELEAGGSRGSFDGFATAHLSDDDGWAEHNASRVRQLFAKAGYRDDAGDIDLTLTLADNALEGTQTLPLSFLGNPRQAYTFPDRNDNKLAFLAAKGSRFVRDDVLVGANAYVRRYRSTNFSSNVNDAFGTTDSETGAVQTNEATNDRSTIDQTTYGVGAQITYRFAHAGVRHQLIAGASGDFGNTRFSQDTQPANFGTDRGTIAAGPFARETDVALDNAYLGVFASDTIALDDAWTLTIAARYNHARIDIADKSGMDPDLEGTHTFARVNPALGVNFNPAPSLTAYASYNEGMRAPTPIELTCADPTAPCKLPNQFLADPALASVVAKTFEAGARGRALGSVQWSAALYRTDLLNDLQFIASVAGTGNAGYFQNVGRTRRQGVEVAATTEVGPFSISARYNHLDATFRSSFRAASPNNSQASDGAIDVHPGDRIPGLPADSLKFRIGYERGTMSAGASLVATSSQFAHGDENNADRQGKLPGYALVDLDGEYRVTPALELFAQISNLFDVRYSNFGLLGLNAFTGPGQTFGPAQGIAATAEQFRAPGAPRGIFVGLRYRFDRRA
jgi:outer membrane receptor protein involved in Fe transport